MSEGYRDKTDEFSFRLRPSTAGIVGVFCLHGIAKGTHLRLFCNTKPTRRIPMEQVQEGTPMWDAVNYYGIRDREEGIYWAPDDFGSMDLGWYLNHSVTPNAVGDDQDDTEYFAARDIEAGEEILVDYSQEYPDDELTPNSVKEKKA